METKIEITDGQISFGRTGWKNLLGRVPDGSYMVSLEEWQTAKTWRQLKFVHKCFDVYGGEFGYTRTEAKALLKQKFGVNKLIKDKQSGKQYLYVRSLAEYSKEQMQAFLDRLLVHFEHDMGLIIDPEIRKQFRLDEETGELEEIA